MPMPAANNRRRYLFALTVLAVCAVWPGVRANAAEDLGALVIDKLRAMGNCDYYGVTPRKINADGDLAYAKILRVFDKEGHMYVRHEVYIAERLAITYITNRDGTFYLLSDGRIVRDDMNRDARNHELTRSAYDRIHALINIYKPVFTEEKGSSSGKGRLAAVAAMEYDREKTEEFMKVFGYTWDGTSEEAIRKEFPSAVRVVIDRKTGFLWSLEAYDANGRSIMSLDYEQAIVNPRFDWAYFQVEANKPLVIVKNAEDLENLRNPPPPSIFSRLGEWLTAVPAGIVQWFFRMAIALLEMNWVFLLIPAVLCLPAAVMIRKRGLQMRGRSRLPPKQR